MDLKEEQYEDYFKKIEEVKAKIKCNNCESKYMVYTPAADMFMCGDCGNIQESRALTMFYNKLIKEQKK